MPDNAESVAPYSPIAERCRRIGNKLYEDARAMRRKATWYEREAKAWEAEAGRLEQMTTHSDGHA